MSTAEPGPQNPLFLGGKGIGPPVDPTPEFCRQLAARIHDDALQSLALCSLQIDLARRLWEGGEVEQALSEVAGISDGLESAVATLREVTNALLAAASYERRER